jgi:hypothetical protein
MSRNEHCEDWAKRAVGRFWTASSLHERNSAATALFNLYRLGDRRCGYELAMLSRSMLPEEVRLSDAERVELIVEQADAGDTGAALELAHGYRKHLHVDRLRQILSDAAARGSLDAGELLAQL